MSRLKHFSSGIIHRISSNKSEGAGFYRFLSNKRVTMEELLHEKLDEVADVMNAINLQPEEAQEMSKEAEMI